MDDRRKNAYRYLFYKALVEVRSVEWFPGSSNPFRWPGAIRRVRRNGAVADWLHNVAAFSSQDFEGFDEDWFWRDFERLRQRWPDVGYYRSIFDREFGESADPIDSS